MRLKAFTFGIMLACSSSAALAHEAPACRSISYSGADYTLCTFDPKQVDIRLFLNGAEGNVLGGVNAINDDLAKSGERLLFAMNAGMYHKDRSPVGLYREGGQTESKLLTKASSGNFGMLPNGVFHVSSNGSAGVTETKQFSLKSTMPENVTQSGPMLVIDGKLHPKFRAGSTSRKIRNGVGKSENGNLVFVKSETPVNFYDFATLFKDKLKAKNALYLDGVISRLYSAELGRNDLGARMGPIVGVVVPKETSEAQYVVKPAGTHMPLSAPADLKQSRQDYFSIPGETREIGE